MDVWETSCWRDLIEALAWTIEMGRLAVEAVWNFLLLILFLHDHPFVYQTWHRP